MSFQTENPCVGGSRAGDGAGGQAADDAGFGRPAGRRRRGGTGSETGRTGRRGAQGAFTGVV